MKRFLSALFILFFLLVTVNAADFSLVNEKFFPIETEVVNRTATTYFVYAGIDSVEIFNADKKLRNKSLRKTNIHIIKQQHV